MKLGIFIGRMQPLHIGHQKIIETSLEENDLTFIILGSKGVQDTSRNIFSDEQRAKFLKIFLKKKTRNKVLFLEDNKSEENWVRGLAIIIHKAGEEYLQATLTRLLGGKNINTEDIDIGTQNFKNTVKQVIFYCGDIDNDYAITIIKKYEHLLDDRNITYKEIAREELVINHQGEKLFISSTRVREELEKGNYELLTKMLHPKILKEIRKI